MKVRDELELEERWSVEDVQKATELLDALDAAEAEGMKRLEDKARRESER